MDHPRDTMALISLRREIRKKQKGPPNEREGVFSEFRFPRGNLKRPIGMEKNINYIDCYSVKLHRTTSGTYHSVTRKVSYNLTLSILLPHQPNRNHNSLRLPTS